MKKSTKILLAIVIFASAIYFVMSRKPWSNFKTERKDFTIKDTASISKIFLADKKGNTVLLQKEENGWRINNTYDADLGKINLLKSTMHDMEVRNPITEKEFNKVVANLASIGTKVEFYNGEELIKTIYVGEATPDGTGTYMIVEGSNTPFVTHIPGFVGYLTPRFLTDPIKWKDKLVFNYTAELISKVSVAYPEKPEFSFEINNLNSIPEVTGFQGSKIVGDPNFARYYLSSFTNLYLESYGDDIKKEASDSIIKQQPFCVIVLKTKNNTTKKLTVYLKGIDQRTKERYDMAGNGLPYDHEKYFAVVDNDKTLAYIQDYNFGRLFRTALDFKGTKK